MAKKYIDAEAAFKVMRDISNHYHETYVSNARAETAEWCLKKLEELPAADVAPAVHAHWRKEYTLGWYDGEQNYKLICPSCNYSYLDNHLGAIVPKHFNYCPNCGAKMDEENNE